MSFQKPSKIKVRANSTISVGLADKRFKIVETISVL